MAMRIFTRNHRGMRFFFFCFVLFLFFWFFVWFFLFLFLFFCFLFCFFFVLFYFVFVCLFVCLFCADGIGITSNSNNNYVFLYVFVFRIMSMLLMNINPHKDIFHNYGFPVYTCTASKYRDPKLDTYRRITPKWEGREGKKKDVQL